MEKFRIGTKVMTIWTEVYTFIISLSLQQDNRTRIIYTQTAIKDFDSVLKKWKCDTFTNQSFQKDSICRGVKSESVRKIGLLMFFTCTQIFVKKMSAVLVLYYKYWFCIRILPFVTYWSNPSKHTTSNTTSFWRWNLVKTTSKQRFVLAGIYIKMLGKERTLHSHLSIYNFLW